MINGRPFGLPFVLANAYMAIFEILSVQAP